MSPGITRNCAATRTAASRSSTWAATAGHTSTASDAYIRFNEEGFAYDWHLTVQRIVGEGQHAASWTEFTGPEGTQPGLCFFDLADDGKIALITDFWPDPYPLPASRAHLVEPY